MEQKLPHFPRKLVYLFLYTEDQKILIQDRRSISKFGEEWGAFGGSFEGEETALEALKRETLEELGIDLIKPNHLGYFTTETRLNDRILDVEIDVFTHPLDVKVSNLNVQEGDGACLFSHQESKELKFVSSIDYEIIDLVFEYLNSLSL